MPGAWHISVDSSFHQSSAAFAAPSTAIRSHGPLLRPFGVCLARRPSHPASRSHKFQLSHPSSVYVRLSPSTLLSCFRLGSDTELNVAVAFSALPQADSLSLGASFQINIDAVRGIEAHCKPIILVARLDLTATPSASGTARLYITTPSAGSSLAAGPAAGVTVACLCLMTDKFQ